MGSTYSSNDSMVISELGFKSLRESDIGSVGLALADLRKGLQFSEPLINFFLTILIFKFF